MSQGPARLPHGGEPPQDIAKAGPDWLDLSTGIAPFAYPFAPPPQETWRNLPRQREERAVLSAAAHHFGLGQEGDICLGPGSQALLQLAPELVPAGAATVLTPTYNEHAHHWALAGHGVEEISDLAELPAQCRYLVVVNPNNPTGEVQERGKLLALTETMAARDGYLIVDEAFCDLLPEASLGGEAGRPGLLVLRSFGKFFGLAGLRLGFLLGPEGFIAMARERIGPWPVDGPALAIAAQAYGDTDWISAHRQALSQQAAKLRRILAGHGNIIGGTDLFVLLQADNSADIAARLAAAHIHVRDFAEQPTWLRLGLPGGEAAWKRFEAALAPI